MLVNRTLLKYVTLILLISSCQTSKKVSGVNTGDNNSYEVFSLKKTACYGACPVFEMVIFSNLEVTFTGEKNTDKLGLYTSRISQQELSTLRNAFDKSFFDFEDEYTSAVSDLPTTFVFYSNGQKTKKIRDYTGAPQELKDLEKLLGNLVTELTWEKDKD